MSLVNTPAKPDQRTGPSVISLLAYLQGSEMIPFLLLTNPANPGIWLHVKQYVDLGRSRPAWDPNLSKHY